MNVDALISPSPMNIDEGQLNSGIESLKQDEHLSMSSPLRLNGLIDEIKTL